MRSNRLWRNMSAYRSIMGCGWSASRRWRTRQCSRSVRDRTEERPMYNRYLTAAQQNREPEPPAEPFCERQCPHREACGAHAEEDSRKEAAHAGGRLTRSVSGLQISGWMRIPWLYLRSSGFVLSDSEEGRIDPELPTRLGFYCCLDCSKRSAASASAPYSAMVRRSPRTRTSNPQEVTRDRISSLSRRPPNAG